MIRMVWYTKEDVSILKYIVLNIFFYFFGSLKLWFEFEVGGSFSELRNVSGFSNFWYTNS